MTCLHKHGDRAADWGHWLCGQCFARLPERPVQYGLAWDAIGGPGGTARQVIIWQSEIRKADGNTLWQFVILVADRFTKKSGLDREAAIEAAIDAIKNLEAEFGDPEFDWSASSACDIADEEMTYWDEAPEELEEANE